MDVQKLSLAECISSAQQGSHEAFRTIFDHLHKRLFAYARGHVRDKESAQDLVQDTMVGIWNALPTFAYQSDESFYAFAFMILKRGIIRTYGKDKRAPQSLETLLEEIGDAVLPKETPEYEDYRTLTKALDTLSDAGRDVLTLRYWSGLSFGEVAETLGINESAAKVRHHRALGELRTILSGYGYGKS